MFWAASVGLLLYSHDLDKEKNAAWKPQYTVCNQAMCLGVTALWVLAECGAQRSAPSSALPPPPLHTAASTASKQSTDDEGRRVAAMRMGGVMEGC